MTDEEIEAMVEYARQLPELNKSAYVDPLTLRMGQALVEMRSRELALDAEIEASFEAESAGQLIDLADANISAEPDREDSPIYSTLAAYVAAIETHGATVGDIPELVARLRETAAALDEVVRLYGHYATLLNQHDGGARMAFASGEEWLVRYRRWIARQR